MTKIEPKELVVVVNGTSASSRVYSAYPDVHQSVVEDFFYELPVAPDQSWFWSDEWQEGEAEAEADLREGRYKTFSSIDDFIAFLDSKNV